MSGDDTAFLESDPPHWAARGLSIIIIVLFVLMLLAAAIVHVPETVIGPLHPRAHHRHRSGTHRPEGIVTSVRAHEGDSVALRRAAVRHPFLVGQRSHRRPAHPRDPAARQHRAPPPASTSSTAARAAPTPPRPAGCQSRATYLERLIKSKTRRLAVMQEIADSSWPGRKRGALGTVEVQRLELDARSLGEEVETATNDLAETRADHRAARPVGDHPAARIPPGPRRRRGGAWSATRSAPRPWAATR